MFYHITKETKNIFINEIRDILSSHPEYQKVKVQGNYTFKEREQYVIIVKISSANKYQLSADNFVGTLKSFGTLARVKNKQSTSIEWVKEDDFPLKNQKEKGRTRLVEFTDEELQKHFDQLVEQGKLAKPGNYWITMIGVDKFLVNPFYMVRREVLVEYANGGEHEFRVKHYPIHDVNPRTTRIWLNGNLATRNQHYSLDVENGIITWLVPGGLNKRDYLEIDYSYDGPEYGDGVDGNGAPIPFQCNKNEINNKAIPGLILAFGDRIINDDQMVIVVERKRREVAKLYGGKWTISLALTVFAMDTIQVEEIADLVTMGVWAIKRQHLLEKYGIIVNSIDVAGLNETTYDETSKELAYTVDITIECEANWEIAIPLLIEVMDISLYDEYDDTSKTDEEIASVPSSLKLVAGLPITGVKKNIEQI